MRNCKKRWLQTGVALCCSFAIVLSVLPTFADDDIQDLEGQTSTLENELQGINKEILSLSEKISTTEMQVEILNGAIARTTDELAATQADEDKRYEDAKARIKYMYEHGNATLLEMLFSAENMADFLNKADFIEHLSEYDRNALDELAAVHKQIEDEQDDLKAQQSSLAELQSELQSQQAELQKKADETSTNLADVQKRLQAAKEEAARKAAAEQAAKEEAARKAAEKAAAEAAAQAQAQAQNNSSSSSNSVSSGNTSSGNSSQGNTSSGNSGSTVVTGENIHASSNDLTLLASIIQCEAIQQYDALLAVATVIMNRVESSLFPNSISGVVYANGQFEPVWTGRLDKVLESGPTSLSMQVAQDAINGARLASVADCYYFLYAGATDRKGVNVGGNVFFQSW